MERHDGDRHDGGLRDWLQQMPKAELHLHLDGSLRAGTALELARTRRPVGVELPADVAGMRARLVAPARCADQAELLRAFALPVALLQDAEALARVTEELVEDVASDGTAYVEIRWAPSLHTDRGLSLPDGIAAVVRGAQQGAARTGVVVRLIAVALRTHAPATAEDVARAACDFVADGLTGFDLAGVEREAPDPTVFGAAFEIARAGGLGITCHAGEWGGASQVRAALAIAPRRIAHGAPAVHDADLMAELARRGVTLDVCPSSNLQAGLEATFEQDPLPTFLAYGVPVTISTDDRTVSDLTLVRELERAVIALGLSGDDVVTCMREAYAAAFLQHDEPIRAALRERFEGWLAGTPAPRPGG